MLFTSKKNLKVLIIFFGILELCRIFLVESQRKTVTIGPTQKWIAYSVTGSGSLSYVVSAFKCMEKEVFKSINFREVFLLLSSLGISTGAFLRTFWELSYVLTVNDSETWLDAFTISTNIIFGLVLTDVLFPTLMLKIFLPIATFSGMLTVIITVDSVNKFVFIFRLITIIFYIACLYTLKERLRWKIFMKRLEDEKWKDLQMKILEEIPTSIAILDTKSNAIIYTNGEFKRWTKGEHPFAFFRKITKLIRRRVPYQGYELNFNLNSELEINKDNLSDAIKKITTEEYRNEDNLKRNNINLDQFSTLETMLTKFQFDKQGDLFKTSWLGIYDGIYCHNEDKISLEIKLSDIAKYPTAVIITINDTTQRDLLVTLQSNNKYKDNLLASISHELRTPLNGTLALLESAIEHRGAPKSIKDEFLIPALRSTQILVHIINDILDYSQIGSNAIRLALEERSIIQTLRDCYSLMELQALKRGLKFVLSIHSNVPRTIVTDHNRIKQILLNLLGNAIKFTFEGEVRIEAKIIEDENILNIAVIDTGIGIKNDEVKRIFNKYLSVYQEDKITKNCVGVGLGLNVANKLAKLLGPPGGQGLIVSSKYGYGSTFSFNIQEKSPTSKFILNTFRSEVYDCSKDLLHIDDAISSLDEFSPEERSPVGLFADGRKFLMPPPPNIKTSFLTKRKKSILQIKEIKDTSGLVSTEAGQILVVDDDPFNILALETLLKPLGLKPDKAFNGEEAITKIIKKAQDHPHENYKLVFMDFNMPIMNGYEATKSLKEKMNHGTLPKIEIIGCTAYNTSNDIEIGIKSGMTEVITKPISTEKILPLIKKYVGI